MSEEIKNPTEARPEEQAPAAEQAPEAEPMSRQEQKQAAKLEEKLRQLEEEAARQEERYKRILAEYDNFRKRTQKEREGLYTDAKADTIGKFLPVFDNLQRAMAQETADEAYKKGVEMTMNGLLAILENLGVTVFGQVGDSFDPNYHNAVMQRDDENFQESTICEVYQTGFKVGEKVIRHAMVVVAN